MESYKTKLLSLLTRKGEVNKAEPPLDIKEAFSKFARGGNQIMKDQLLRFMVDHQGEKINTFEDLEKIVQKVLQVGSSSTKTSSNSSVADVLRRQGLSLNDFIDFLLLDDFNGPLKEEVHHDMSAPLSHYFMYTGHNSYLTGNQLTSESSDEPIIEALQQGVRVIELDLWPSSTKDGIKVVHGRTLTTPVSLTKCLRSIKEYAFVKSDFPVILTLEDHLSSTLQDKFAAMATQIFGEMLYCPQTDCLTEFPSPESLKNRIVISTKPPKEYPQSSISKPMPNESDSSEEESRGLELQDSMAKLKTEDKNASDEDHEDINECDNIPNQQDARQYKHLITIYGGKSKGSMKDRLKDDTKVRRLSLSEKKLKSACESHGADLIRFTQKNILRVYPKGERVQSSNFRPHLGWIYGAQMVAFNMQGHDKSLRLMQGLFRANGGCGYVKKPEFLIRKLPHEEEFHPKRTMPVKQILKVKVYRGDGWSSDFSATHFDRFSPPDFYTKVYIVGVPADSDKKKTKVKMDTWYPVWDEEFEFPLTVPELALLRIEVKDKDKGKDDFAGQTCLPVSELRHGFRSVPLYDRKGKKFNSVKLLMRFKLEI
ncbi:phosphoinositide phospholipase C 6-like [Abrus precatorius]|uniref:Phosphoinositide phospholipase C n=1 Tax=Abrus precatorius TaxID=3816 RepID=A0A8B8K1G1_ABRPR|nr:phosphoinositide phospholipase C 6-like [Abrus precatorius]